MPAFPSFPPRRPHCVLTRCRTWSLPSPTSMTPRLRQQQLDLEAAPGQQRRQPLGAGHVQGADRGELRAPR